MKRGLQGGKKESYTTIIAEIFFTLVSFCHMLWSDLGGFGNFHLATYSFSTWWCFMVQLVFWKKKVLLYCIHRWIDTQWPFLSGPWFPRRCQENPTEITDDFTDARCIIITFEHEFDCDWWILSKGTHPMIKGSAHLHNQVMASFFLILFSSVFLLNLYAGACYITLKVEKWFSTFITFFFLLHCICISSWNLFLILWCIEALMVPLWYKLKRACPHCGRKALTWCWGTLQCFESVFILFRVIKSIGFIRALN